MKTVLSLLGLIAVASASPYVRTTGDNRCPTVHGQDARLGSRQACLDAANTFGMHFAGDAGQEHWQDGCIVNHGSAYWVPIGQGPDSATQGPHNGGSICLSGTSALRHATQWCGPHGGEYGSSIMTFEECKAAAADFGFDFHNEVDWLDQDWYSGCITQPHFNEGRGHKAYFVPYDGNYESNGNHHKATDRHYNGHNLMGGYICHNDRYDLRTPEPAPTPEPVPDTPEPGPCDAHTDTHWGAKTCDDKSVDFKLDVLAHRLKNFCVNNNGVYTSSWGKRCAAWCCNKGF